MATIKEPAEKLEVGTVQLIEYKCRDIGHGQEEGIFAGYWTGERDAWGKRTIRSVTGQNVYLFDDEIIEVRHTSGVR